MGKRKRELAAVATTPASSFKYSNVQAEEEYSQAPVSKEKDSRLYQRKTTTVQHYPENNLEDGEPVKIKASANFIGDEERLYLKAIKDELMQAVQQHNSKTSAKETVDDEDDADGSSFEIIWDRIKGREVLIAKDKELSFILENLIRLTGAMGVSHIIATFIQQSEDTPTLIQDLVCHSCASHIIEEIFERIALLPSFTKDIPIERFIDFLLINPSVYTENPYAAHVAEKMLLRLCHIIKFTLANNQLVFTIYDPKGSTQDILYQREDSSRFSTAILEVFTHPAQKIVRRVIAAFQSILSGPDRIWRSAAGSVVLQSWLVAIVAHSISSGDSFPEIQPFIDNFLDMSKDKYGSRVVELLVALSSSDVYLQLINLISSPEFNMKEFIQDIHAHHIIIKLVEFASDIPLLLILTKVLCEMVDVILSAGHGMVLVAISKKLADIEQKKAMCGRHGSAAEWNQCQMVFVSALKTFYLEHGPQGWNDEQKRDYFVIVVAALYPKNFRKDPKITVQNICMPGSQIVQSLCLFKESSTVNNSFLKLDPELLTEYCSNVFGSFVIEKSLATQKGQKNFFPSFLNNLINVSPDLAMTKFGSRIFDNVWKSVDLKNREVIVEKLLPVEAKLRTNEFGRFLLTRLNLGLYRRSVEAWRSQQLVYEKQKSDLLSILEMSGRKKV